MYIYIHIHTYGAPDAPQLIFSQYIYIYVYVYVYVYVYMSIYTYIKLRGPAVFVDVTQCV